MKTTYAVVTGDGLLLNKDGNHPKPIEDLTAKQLKKYTYKHRDGAESFVNWQDPDGLSELRVREVEYEFTIDFSQ